MVVVAVAPARSRAGPGAVSGAGVGGAADAAASAADGAAVGAGAGAGAGAGGCGGSGSGSCSGVFFTYTPMALTFPSTWYRHSKFANYYSRVHYPTLSWLHPTFYKLLLYAKPPALSYEQLIPIARAPVGAVVSQLV